MYTWILTNPLSAGLAALLLAVGTYTTVLKFENLYLDTRNTQLEKVAKERDEQEALAFKRMKIKVEQGKIFSAQLQKDNENANRKNLNQRARIDDLARQLRNANRCIVPAAAPGPEGADGPVTGELSRSGGDLLTALLNEYTSLAKSAEVTRLRAQTCKEYAEGLE